MDLAPQLARWSPFDAETQRELWRTFPALRLALASNPWLDVSVRDAGYVPGVPADVAAALVWRRDLDASLLERMIAGREHRKEPLARFVALASRELCSRLVTAITADQEWLSRLPRQAADGLLAHGRVPASAVELASRSSFDAASSWVLNHRAELGDKDAARVLIDAAEHTSRQKVFTELTVMAVSRPELARRLAAGPPAAAVVAARAGIGPAAANELLDVSEGWRHSGFRQVAARPLALAPSVGAEVRQRAAGLLDQSAARSAEAWLAKVRLPDHPVDLASTDDTALVGRVVDAAGDAELPEHWVPTVAWQLVAAWSNPALPEDLRERLASRLTSAPFVSWVGPVASVVGKGQLGPLLPEALRYGYVTTVGDRHALDERAGSPVANVWGRDRAQEKRAGGWPVVWCYGDANTARSVGSRLVQRLADRPEAWSVLLTLVDGWSGTTDELADTARTLSV